MTLKKKCEGLNCAVSSPHIPRKKENFKNCMWTMVTFIQGMSAWKAKKQNKKNSFLLFLYLEFSINQQFSVGALKYSVLLFALFINRVFCLFCLFIKIY